MSNPDDSVIRDARRYDGVADVYERVNAPRMFEAPAREFVSIVAPDPGARVLDVGAGTGAVARALGSRARVVALDASLPMIEAARRGGIELTVVAALPDLPFLDSSFDVVLSAFVLTHVDDPEAAARAMARVLRPGGSLGLAAWGSSQDAYASAWMEVVHEFVAEERMTAAAAPILPGEARFSQPGGSASLLVEAGLVDVRETTRRLQFSMTVAEYVAAREASGTARVLRMLLDDRAWTRFRERSREVFASRFRDGVSYARDVHYAIACR